MAERHQQQRYETSSGPREGRGGRERRGDDRHAAADGLFEKVISINRVASVAKGGRNFRFSALVVVGDGAGQVGLGLGKAREVPVAVQKGREQAIKDMKAINLRGTTIPHEVMGVFSAGRVLLRPASRGTGIKAGGPVRALAEALGVRDILTKSLGSNNPLSMVRAALQGFRQLQDVQEVRMLRGVAAAETKGERT